MVDQRFMFDLDQRIANTFRPHDRCLLVGDAARVLHPLAGQGVNIGFEDVAELMDTVARCGPSGDLGAPGLWRSYARRRRAKALLLLRAMDGFRIGYAIDDPLLRLIRNVGAAAVDRSAGLKAQLMREAMGLGLSG